MKHIISGNIKNETNVQIELGKSNDLYLNDNMKYNNVILIFKNINLSNILFLFRTLNISIFGGYNTKRHILSTVQVSLVKFFLSLKKV